MWGEKHMKKLINILFFLVTIILFVSCGGEKVPEDMLGEYYINTQITEYQSNFTKAKALVEKKGNKYHITLESSYYSGGRTYISRPPVKAELARKETLEIVAKVKIKKSCNLLITRFFLFNVIKKN